MALTQTQVSELYVAIFNRASEGDGNKFWQTKEATSAATADAMLATTDAKAYFGTKLDSKQAFIEHIYLNTLNKTYAQDKAGVDYWVSQLDAGKSRGEVVAELVYAVSTYKDSTDPVTKAAYDQFNNRVDVSNYMANTVEKVPANFDTSTKFATTGTTGLVVTNSASTVTTAKTSVDTLKPVDGKTFSLTAGTDDLKGTDNADLFKAVNSSAIAEGTLQGADKIDGGAGNDTLKVDMKQNFDGFTTGSMKNVENVELTNSSNANLEFAASKIEGATKYVVTDAVDKNTTISDLASLASVEISGTADTADTTLKVSYNASSTVATGTQTDVQNLKVTNQGSINTAAANVASNAKVMTVDIDKVETLAITTAGTANSLNLAASADVKTVTVAGEGQTEIQAVGTATTSFDASAATGKVIANLSNAASNSLTTVKGGSSDDSLTVEAGDLTTSATVAGGAGSDKLIIGAGAGKTLQLAMTGVETLEVGAITTPALIFSGTNVSDLTTLKVEGLANTVSLVNSKATDLTVNSVASTGAATISTDNAAKVTYNMDATAANLAANTQTNNTAAATFSNATNLTVNVNKAVNSTGAITAANATDVKVNVDTKVANGAEQTIFANTLTADKAKTITVDSKGKLVATIKADEATTATITAGSTFAVADTLVLDAAKLNTLNITAKQDFSLLTGSSLTKVQNMTVDTTKAFTMGTTIAPVVALPDAANVTVSGTATTSSATFGTLGAVGLTHDVNLTATGLKAGLTLGNIDSNSGIKLTATNLEGNLNASKTIATASTLTTTTGKIDVDVSNAKGTVTLGTLTSTTGSGDVTLNASSTVGAVAVDAITGNNVTINGKGALNGMTINDGAGGATDVTAKTSVTYTGTNIANNGIDIKTHGESTAFTATLNGGDKDEKITIAGNTKQTGITVTGNLGATTGLNNQLVTVTLVDNTGYTVDGTHAQSVNLSGLTSSGTANDSTGVVAGAGNYETNTVLTVENNDAVTFTGSAKDDLIVHLGGNAKAVSIVDTTLTDKDMLSLTGTFDSLTVSGIEGITAAGATNINASAISGQTITVTNTAALTLKGTAGADVVDLSKITTTAAATNLVVDLGAGNDTIVLGTGAQTVKFAAANGKDTISGFDSGVDKLDFSALLLVGSIKAVTNNATDTNAAGSEVIAGNAYVIDSAAQDLGAAVTTTAVITDFTSVTQTLAFLQKGFVSTAATAESALFVINDSATDNAYVWTYADLVGDATTNLSGGTLTLVGTVSLVSGENILSTDIAI